jgi:sRNA-binding carbon storage regulator CsrA
MSDSRKTRLVVTRNEGQAVWIGDVRVKIEKKGKMVIEAPKGVRIVREELLERPAKSA